MEFECNLEITKTGFKIRQSIKKSAQGGFIIRALNSVNISTLFKSLIEAIKVIM